MQPEGDWTLFNDQEYVGRHPSPSLHEVLEDTVKNAIDMCYGTDERHGLIATAVADQVVYNKPIPWKLKSYFGG